MVRAAARRLWFAANRPVTPAKPRKHAGYENHHKEPATMLTDHHGDGIGAHRVHNLLLVLPDRQVGWVHGYLIVNRRSALTTGCAPAWRGRKVG